MKIEKIISDFVGISEEDIKKNILKEDGSYTDAAEGYISDLLKEKVKKHATGSLLKEEEVKNYEKKGYKMAMEMAIGKLSEVYPDADLNKEMKFDDVVSTIKQKKIEPLPDDQIKLHPLYRELEKNRVPKEDYEKTLTEFENYKKGIQRKETLNSVKSLAYEILKDYKLPEDNILKQKRVDVFINHTFGGFDFEKDNNDFLLIKDGKRFEDENYNAVTATKRIKEQAEILFDRKEAAKPDGQIQERQNQTQETAVPTTIDEFNKMRAAISEPKELVEFNNKYKEKFKNE